MNGNTEVGFTKRSGSILSSIFACDGFSRPAFAADEVKSGVKYLLHITLFGRHMDELDPMEAEVEEASVPPFKMVPKRTQDNSNWRWYYQGTVGDLENGNTNLEFPIPYADLVNPVTGAAEIEIVNAIVRSRVTETYFQDKPAGFLNYGYVAEKFDLNWDIEVIFPNITTVGSGIMCKELFKFESKKSINPDTGKVKDEPPQPVERTGFLITSTDHGGVYYSMKYRVKLVALSVLTWNIDVEWWKPRAMTQNGAHWEHVAPPVDEQPVKKVSYWDSFSVNTIEYPR